MAFGDIHVYFEGSWAILSSIGLINTLFGLMVIGITGYSPITLVPIVVSASAAVANGLCFYAFYSDHGTYDSLLGVIFADMFWLIQEAGLSFYSYMILNRILSNRPRVIFLTLFWFHMIAIFTLRMSILVCRAQNFVKGSQYLMDLVAHFHIGYFIAIALVEIISAYFLLSIFSQAKRGSAEVAKRGGLFQYLRQSTELRLASLAFIGVTRAITYSFQTRIEATSVTGQLDRFVFTLECMFPTVMYIDILASRIARVTNSHPSLSNHAGYPNVFPPSNIGRSINTYPMNFIKRKTDIPAYHVSSSQERIVDGPGDDNIGVKSTVMAMDSQESKGSNGPGEFIINKTVEFGFESTP